MKKIISLLLLLGLTQMVLAQGTITLGGDSGNSSGIASGSSGGFSLGNILTLGIDFSPLPGSQGTNQPSGSASYGGWTPNSIYINISLGLNAATDGWVYEKEDDGSFLPMMELTNEISIFAIGSVHSYVLSWPLTADQLVSLMEGKWYAEVDYGNDKYLGNLTPSFIAQPTATITVSPVAEFPAVTSGVLLENSFSEVVITPNHNGLATVILDGSASTDPFGFPLQYTWMDGANILANTMAITNACGTGTYQISLTVDDGLNTATENLTLEVISPDNAVNALGSVVEQSSLKREKKRILTSKLEKAQNSFARRDARSAQKFLTDFQRQVRIEMMSTDSATANWLINGAQEIIDATVTQRPNRF